MEVVTGLTEGVGKVGSTELIANRYQIERRIARGGQASVFLARQVPLDRKVALKVLNPPPGVNAARLETFRERFLLEAKTLATLDHPNIVVVYDYGQIKPEQYYIAMEFVEGQRFGELLKDGPMKPTRLLALGYQVCEALRYAHSLGVVHRDVKNSNILVRVDHQGNEQVKVVDFGIAKLQSGEADLTNSGVLLGSPHFMAPEQARPDPVDHRVDIYAMGVFLYRGLVGQYPFSGQSFRDVIAGHLVREVPRFVDLNPDIVVADGLEQVVRRCLEKKASRRYQSIDDVMADLEPFLDDPIHGTNTLVGQEMGSDFGRRGIRWGLVAALVTPVIFAGLVVLFLAGRWVLDQRATDAEVPELQVMAPDQNPERAPLDRATTAAIGENEQSSSEDAATPENAAVVTPPSPVREVVVETHEDPSPQRRSRIVVSSTPNVQPDPPALPSPPSEPAEQTTNETPDEPSSSGIGNDLRDPWGE